MAHAETAIPRLYTLQELADNRHVHIKTVYRWRRQGRLQVIELSDRTLRVSEDTMRNPVLPAAPVEPADAPPQPTPPGKRRPGRPRKHPKDWTC